MHKIIFFPEFKKQQQKIPPKTCAYPHYYFQTCYPKYTYYYRLA